MIAVGSDDDNSSNGGKVQMHEYNETARWATHCEISVVLQRACLAYIICSCAYLTVLRFEHKKMQVASTSDLHLFARG